MKKKECLFLERTVGNHFFIILKGWCSICKDLRVTKNDDENRIYEKEGNLYREIKLLGAGEAFGELALIENSKRNASVFCMENTHFAVLSKNVFDKILRENEKMVLSESVNFFLSVKPFSLWSFNSIKNLYYTSFFRTFARGKHVYNFGDMADSIFLVFEGEFAIITKIDGEFVKNDLNDLYFHMKRKTISPDRNYTVAKIGKGGLFGQEDLFCNTHQYTVVCNTPTGKVFEIPRKEFVRYTFKDENNKNLVEDEYYIRNKIRADRLAQYTSFLNEKKVQEDKKDLLKLKINAFSNYSKEEEMEFKFNTKLPKKISTESQRKSVLKIFGLTPKEKPKEKISYSKTGEHIGVHNLTPERVHPSNVKSMKTQLKRKLNTKTENASYDPQKYFIKSFVNESSLNKDEKRQKSVESYDFEGCVRRGSLTSRREDIEFKISKLKPSNSFISIGKSTASTQENQTQKYFLPLKYESHFIKSNHKKLLTRSFAIANKKNYTFR